VKQHERPLPEDAAATVRDLPMLPPPGRTPP